MLALLMLLAAAPALQPGLWEQRNDPGAASLAGRPLTDLPIDPIKTDRICLTPAEAAEPAKWFSRDTLSDCMLDRAKLDGGKVDIAGTCTPPDDGLKRGTVKLTGRYDAQSFDIAFATTTDTTQGMMGFAGRMQGRRVGDCPAAATMGDAR